MVSYTCNLTMTTLGLTNEERTGYLIFCYHPKSFLLCCVLLISQEECLIDVFLVCFHSGYLRFKPT